jgi:glutathione S-transferase
MSRPHHRLVTLAFSHYNEKARWALDWCGIRYREQRYLPGFSQLAVLAATRGRGGRADRVSTRLSTPVLVTDDGRALCDSTDIARWASATIAAGEPGPLFPDREVDEWVERFGSELGPYTRLAAYYHALRAPAAMRVLMMANVGAAQAVVFRAIAPLGMKVLARSLGVTAERAERATQRVRTEIERVEARLAGRRYLVGDTFTAADLTFAALLAPVLLVTAAEGYGATFPEADLLPAEARALVAELRARPAGKYALEMYRRHRRERPS